MLNEFATIELRGIFNLVHIYNQPLPRYYALADFRYEGVNCSRSSTLEFLSLSHDGCVTHLKYSYKSYVVLRRSGCRDTRLSSNAPEKEGGSEIIP